MNPIRHGWYRFQTNVTLHLNDKVRPSSPFICTDLDVQELEMLEATSAKLKRSRNQKPYTLKRPDDRLFACEHALSTIE